MKRRVSVLMTIYNPGRFLAQAVDSLLAQTLGDFELVAVENGSTDGSKAVMRAYAARDPRIRIIDLPANIGRTPALNLALNQARGDYIAVLDADDRCAPERLERQAALLDAKPEVELVGSAVRLIDDSDTVIGTMAPPCDSARLRDALAYSNPFAHSACMYRRATAARAGGYPAEYAYCQDFALWLELAQRGALAAIEQPLTDIRDHGARAGRSAEFATARFREPIRLYERLLRTWKLSPEVRRRARANLATIHYAYGQAAMQSGRPMRSLRAFAAGFATDPGYCFGRLPAHAGRALARLKAQLWESRA